jgi:hypothetical protein
VLAMLLILFVCLGNLALGFALAVHFGHGPPGVELSNFDEIRNRLRTLLGRGRSA